MHASPATSPGDRRDGVFDMMANLGATRLDRAGCHRTEIPADEVTHKPISDGTAARRDKNPLELQTTLTSLRAICSHCNNKYAR